MAASVSADFLSFGLRHAGAVGWRTAHVLSALWRATLQLSALWLGCVAGPLLSAPAVAHPMPESRVWIDTRPHGLALTLQIPLNRLELAFGHPLAEHPQQVLPRHQEALSTYLLQHVGAREIGRSDLETSPAGTARGWTAYRPTLHIRGDGPAAELEANLVLQAPPGSDPRRLNLLIDAVTHEVVTHRLQVFLRNDWSGGVAGRPPRLLGDLGSGRQVLSLELGQPAATRAGTLGPLVAHGMLHIANGVDHLMFLALLLLVAPLQAARGRWTGARSPREALLHIGWVISAFTLGHSLALALGVNGLLQLPAQPVEAAVAATIAIAAVHVARPLFGAVEGAMALTFGLIHGQAFAGALATAGLTPPQLLQALLAFNAGIELAQLALVTVVLPPLLHLLRCRPAPSRRLRHSLSALAGTMALGWFAERIGWVAEVAPLAWLDQHPMTLALLPGALWWAWAVSWMRKAPLPEPA